MSLKKFPFELHLRMSHLVLVFMHWNTVFPLVVTVLDVDHYCRIIVNSSLQTNILLTWNRLETSKGAHALA